MQCPLSQRSLKKLSLRTRSQAQAPSPASTGPLHSTGKDAKPSNELLQRPVLAFSHRELRPRPPGAYASVGGQRRLRGATQPSHTKQATSEREQEGRARSPFPPPQLQKPERIRWGNEPGLK